VDPEKASSLMHGEGTWTMPGGGFLCLEYEGEPKVMEPDEITKRERFPLDQLPSPMFFPSEKVIKNYLAGIIYK
jgi:hypothetical protein